MSLTPAFRFHLSRHARICRGEHSPEVALPRLRLCDQFPFWVAISWEFQKHLYSFPIEFVSSLVKVPFQFWFPLDLLPHPPQSPNFETQLGIVDLPLPKSRSVFNDTSNFVREGSPFKVICLLSITNDIVNVGQFTPMYPVVQSHCIPKLQLIGYFFSKIFIHAFDTTQHRMNKEEATFPRSQPLSHLSKKEDYLDYDQGKDQNRMKE